jgi:photosystem II oxygen-evolving enhancer protein 2
MNTVLSSSITAARVATVQTSKRNVAVKAEVRFPSRFAVSSLVALARRLAYVASDYLWCHQRGDRAESRRYRWERRGYRSLLTTTRDSLRKQLARSHTQVDRRATLGMLAGAAALTSVPAANAEYGDAARVFAGTITNKSGFVPFAGEGFALLLPSKWNPSKEKDFPGVVLRYEDNFDAVNNLMVIQQKVGKGSIDELGSPDKFIQDNSYLLGETAAFGGDTISEGGFKRGKVAAASVLDVQEATDKNGKKYYKYDILCRTADGDEGGRHQLVAATVSKGDLWILKIQIGDKRWFKGAKVEAEGAFDSFTVA